MLDAAHEVAQQEIQYTVCWSVNHCNEKYQFKIQVSETINYFDRYFCLLLFELVLFRI